MEFLLTNYRNTINERNLLNQSPLHLAIGHPSCIALLLRESGHKLINLPDSEGRRPLEYALFSCLVMNASDDRYHDGCLKNYGDTSLKILLDAGCMIPKVQSWPCEPYDSFGSLCDSCLQAVLANFVGRREDLKRLAANNLPRMQAAALGLLSPHILDSNAARVIHELNEYGISVAPSLRVHESDGEEGYNDWTSAYHNYGQLPFPALWSLGFRDLNTPDMDGLTPLMFWCEQLGLGGIDRCSWLIDNGADLWKLVPDGVSTVGHVLYSKIGPLTPGPPPRDGGVLPVRRQLFNLTRELSHRDPRDRCRCACSPGGCTPFARYLQAAFGSRNINSASGLIEQLPKIMEYSHTSVTKVQMRAAVRYATFHMLGIRHTCCHDDSGQKFDGHQENEELDELRQEDCFLVTLLEDLAAEFELELEKSSQKRVLYKRVSFWHGYWLPRMQQVLESIESAEIEACDKVAAEEIGVVWQNQEPGRGKDRDDGSNFENNSYSASEDGEYHESDWDSEIDEDEMFETFRVWTTEDWYSRLDLIMSKAGLSASR